MLIKFTIKKFLNSYRFIFSRIYLLLAYFIYLLTPYRALKSVLKLMFYRKMFTTLFCKGPH